MKVKIKTDSNQRGMRSDHVFSQGSWSIVPETCSLRVAEFKHVACSYWFINGETIGGKTCPFLRSTVYEDGKIIEVICACENEEMVIDHSYKPIETKVRECEESE
jgi:hypothetical protein